MLISGVITSEQKRPRVPRIWSFDKVVLNPVATRFAVCGMGFQYLPQLPVDWSSVPEGTSRVERRPSRGERLVYSNHHSLSSTISWPGAKRRGRDSNPGGTCIPAGFHDRTGFRGKQCIQLHLQRNSRGGWGTIWDKPMSVRVGGCRRASPVGGMAFATPVRIARQYRRRF